MQSCTIGQVCPMPHMYDCMHWHILFLQAFGEEAVKDAFPSATIVRPSDTYGHEDRFLNYYASLRVFPFGMVPVMKGAHEAEKMPVYVSTCYKLICVQTRAP